MVRDPALREAEDCSRQKESYRKSPHKAVIEWEGAETASLWAGSPEE